MSDSTNAHDDKPMIPEEPVPRQMSDDPVAGGDPEATADAESSDADDPEAVNAP